jgi:hypothetical protein
MDSENEKLRKALAHLIRVVEQHCADIVDVVEGAFQPVSSPVINEMNRALVQIEDLMKDLDHLALEKDCEVEHMDYLENVNHPNYSSLSAQAAPLKAATHLNQNKPFSSSDLVR